MRVVKEGNPSPVVRGFTDHNLVSLNSLTNSLREGFKKEIKKKYGIFHKGEGVPPDFGSVSILFFLFLNMV